MLYKKNDKKSLFKSRLIRVFGGVVLASMLFACSSIGMNHDVCDLRVLSLLIPQQSEDAKTGRPEAIDALQKSQEKLKLVFPSAVKKISNQTDAESLTKEVDAVNANIDLIIKNRKNLNQIYEYNLAVADTIPGIQAEYNLMTDTMARDNYPSTQVVIAKNQVFIAERILRSMLGITSGHDDQMTNVDDFLADVETFNVYLKAQLNGAPELGIQRVNDAELRSSLESIQRDMDEIVTAGSMNLFKTRDQVYAVSKAVSDNQEKSTEIFNKLQKLE